MGKNRVQSGAGRSEQGITEILGLHGGQGHGREGGRAGGDRGGEVVVVHLVQVELVLGSQHKAEM